MGNILAIALPILLEILKALIANKGVRDFIVKKAAESKNPYDDIAVGEMLDPALDSVTKVIDLIGKK